VIKTKRSELRVDREGKEASGLATMNIPLVTPTDTSLRLEQYGDTALSLRLGELELARYVYRSDARRLRARISIRCVRLRAM